MKKYFTLLYWIDNGWYVGIIKEIPGVFSQGESLRELEENIKEAYQLLLEDIPIIQSSDIKMTEIALEI